MSVVKHHAPGAPCWFELSTTDQDGAKTFYTALFGWTIEDYEMGPAGVYTIFQAGGMDVAAANAARPGQRTVWLVYFHSPDVDASLATAKHLGGNVIAGPFEAGPYGRMAVLADPEGAVFALWQPKQRVGAQRLNESGAVAWTELLTADIGAASRFYSQLLGLHPTLYPGGETPYVELMSGPDRLAGLLQKEPGMQNIPAHWSFYVQVADCDETAAAAQELGGTLLYGPYDAMDGVRMAVLRDPQGGKFNLIQLKPAA